MSASWVTAEHACIEALGLVCVCVCVKLVNRLMFTNILHNHDGKYVDVMVDPPSLPLPLYLPKFKLTEMNFHSHKHRPPA